MQDHGGKKFQVCTMCGWSWATVGGGVSRRTRDYCGLTVAGGTGSREKGACQAYRLSGAVKGSPFIIKQARGSICSGAKCMWRWSGPEHCQKRTPTTKLCLRDPQKLPCADNLLQGTGRLKCPLGLRILKANNFENGWGSGGFIKALGTGCLLCPGAEGCCLPALGSGTCWPV